MVYLCKYPYLQIIIFEECLLQNIIQFHVVNHLSNFLDNIFFDFEILNMPQQLHIQILVLIQDQFVQNNYNVRQGNQSLHFFFLRYHLEIIQESQIPSRLIILAWNSCFLILFLKIYHQVHGELQYNHLLSYLCPITLRYISFIMKLVIITLKHLNLIFCLL